MKEEKKVTNFKETDDVVENLEGCIEMPEMTIGEKLDFFLIKHGPKIKAAALGLASIAAVGVGYLIVTGLKEEAAAANGLEGISTDSLGSATGNIFDEVAEKVDSAF